MGVNRVVMFVGYIYLFLVVSRFEGVVGVDSLWEVVVGKYYCWFDEYFVF